MRGDVTDYYKEVIEVSFQINKTSIYLNNKINLIIYCGNSWTWFMDNRPYRERGKEGGLKIPKSVLEICWFWRSNCQKLFDFYLSSAYS